MCLAHTCTPTLCSEARVPRGGPWVHRWPRDESRAAQATCSPRASEPVMGDVWHPACPVLLSLLGRLGVRTWQGRAVSLAERAQRRPCPLGGNRVSCLHRCCPASCRSTAASRLTGTLVSARPGARGLWGESFAWRGPGCSVAQGQSCRL